MKKLQNFSFLPSKRDINNRTFFAKNKNFCGKIDVIILTVVAVCVIIACVFTFTKKTGDYAEVYYEGDLVYSFNLKNDATLKFENIQGCPTIQVEDGRIAVVENDCESQICVKTGFISKVGERIVCAPNKLVIVIKGSKKSEYAAVTGGV